MAQGWVGDDGRIVEPEPEEAPKTSVFDQDDIDPEETMRARLEQNFGPEIEGPVVFAEPRTVPMSTFASAARVDAIEQKLDKLIRLLTPPESERAASGFSQAELYDVEAPPFGATGPYPSDPVVDTVDPTVVAPVAEVRASAKVEALKAEQEARQAHGNVPPEEAVAQGLGISTPRPGPEDIEDGRGFRDKPAAADDPFEGLG